jgi:adenosylcobinamide kinase / adenosylcobinamide-phosphate guanylyltransferase
MIGHMNQTLSQLTLVLGGARSRKSTYIQKLAEQHKGQALYVATAEAEDAKMADRIAVHRSSRPKHWYTLESPCNVRQTIIDQIGDLKPDLIIAMPKNELFNQAQPVINHEMEGFISVFQTPDFPWIIVSNETGLDLVLLYQLSKVFRDVLG